MLGSVGGRARQLLVDARAGYRLYRGTGLDGAFGPIDAARLVRDAVLAPRHGAQVVIHAHAVADPQRPAIVSGALRLSYEALDLRCNRITHALSALGIRTGDRVGLLLENGHELVELHVALSAIGAIGVQIGYRLKADEVGYILANSGCKALFFHHALAPLVDEVLAQPRKARASISHATAIANRPVSGYSAYEPWVATGDPLAPHAPSGDGWGGVMLYTSGTTSRGKGARRDFANMGISAALNMLAQLPLRRDDRHLVVSPMYHALAAMCVAPVIGIGGCLVIADHFDAEEMLATIARERITSTLVVPTMLSRILALPRSTRDRYDTSSLRWILSGAAPLPTELARRTEDAFGPILYNMYGATESGLVTLALPGEHTARPGTIGRAIPGNEIRLIDEDGAVGDRGELYVKSNMMMDAYHGDDAATNAARRDGFVTVGDLAHRDADGYYYITDRKSDLVISGGVNIYPWEIEQRLLAHPSVAEAAVVGVPDEEWGEALVAWLVPRGDRRPDLDELRAFVRETLADYKRPREIVWVDALPRNPTGKVLKRELRSRDGARS